MIESTKAQPILFFQRCLNEQYINLLKEDFYNVYREPAKLGLELSPFEINEQEETITYLLGEYTVGEKPTGVLSFKRELKIRLYSELQKSKSLIDESLLQSGDIQGLLQIRLRELEEIKSKSVILFEARPICKQVLESLMEYINIKLGNESINNSPTSTKDDSITLEEASIAEKNQIVDDIFGFLKGENAQGQQIMSESECNRLIEAIKEMVEKEESPEIKKFQKINIPNDLLRYCFYILHLKLYGIRPQRKYFIDFIKQNLEQFSNMERQTIESTFSKKPHKQEDDYIPQIIRNHFPPPFKKHADNH
jgi:hypothetical protein